MILVSQISVNLQDVSKRFGKKEVLHNISLSIAQTEIFGLVGPSEMYNYNQIENKIKRTSVLFIS